MTADATAASIIAGALQLRASHPKAPARDLLDLVMQDRAGQRIDFGDLSPVSPFGLIVLEAFDLASPVCDWIAFYRHGDPRAVAVFDGLWRNEVWPAFVAQYRLQA